jgi:hypothetical protein
VTREVVAINRVRQLIVADLRSTDGNIAAKAKCSSEFRSKVEIDDRNNGLGPAGCGFAGFDRKRKFRPSEGPAE